MKHELKTIPFNFHAVALGLKTFEIRKNDCDFQVGDTLVLREYDTSLMTPSEFRNPYTGAELAVTVVYMLDRTKIAGIAEGYVVMGIELNPTEWPKLYVADDQSAPPENRFCADCAHSANRGPLTPYALCRKSPRDPVTGAYSTCRSMRDSIGGNCGSTGTLWEPRPAKVGWWRRLVG